MKRRLALAVVVIAALGGGAQATTIGYADAIKILADGCGKDIEKFCAKASLANFEIGSCLKENQARLSGSCAADIVRVRESLDARIAAQASVLKVCNRDIQRLCPPKLMKAGEGHILVCMLKAEPSVSAACNAAITDAGYR
jgi:hypothetical protein